MPDDANGQYSLPGGYLAITGTTIQPSQHNPPLEDVATALSARLSRNGSAAMTGPLKAADGTVGAPSYTFNTAQTTGFYKTAGGNVACAIAGAKVLEIGPSGMLLGGKNIGEIFDWTGSAAPALCVLLQGQTLSRTTYAALWAFAQTEIAAGNTLYNNGDGSTTFGIADMRGRVRAARDTSGTRLTTTVSPNGNTLGATGGAETKTIVTANLPPYTPAGTGTFAANNGPFLKSAGGVVVNVPAGSSPPGADGVQAGTGGLVQPSGNITFTGTAQGGTSTAFSLLQPTLVTIACLFAGA